MDPDKKKRAAKSSGQQPASVPEPTDADRPSQRLHGDSYSEASAPQEDPSATSSSHSPAPDRRPEEPADERELRDDMDAPTHQSS